MRDRPFTISAAVRALLLSLGVLLGVGGCAHTTEQRFDFTRVVMGVQARISLFAPSEIRAESAAAAAFATMAAVEEQTSDYRVDNAVALLAKRAGSGEWTTIGPHLEAMLRYSTQLAAQTDGAFDPTMGPLTKLWRRQRQSSDRLLREDDIAAARMLVNWRWIEMDGSRARLAMPRMGLDFGGIAKGYAAECAVRELQRCGVPRCLVSVAGDVFAGEAPPGLRGWRVAVQAGQGGSPAAGSVDEWIELAGAGCSTSGDVEQVVDIGGKRQSHIIDVRTGRGSSRQASVTVIAPQGWQSDALATILYLLNDEQGQRVLNQYPGTRAIIFEPAVDQSGNQLRRREINSAAARMSEMR